MSEPLTPPPEPIVQVAFFTRLAGAFRREPWLVGGLAFIATLNIVSLALINRNQGTIKGLAQENRKVLAVQVPALRARIAERDETIAALQFVLTSQATPAIISLSEQVEKLGGKRPNVLLGCTPRAVKDSALPVCPKPPKQQEAP